MRKKIRTATEKAASRRKARRGRAILARKARAIETIASGSACDAAANLALRQGIYAGKIYRITSSVAAKQLVAAVVALLAEEFGPAPLEAFRRLQFTLPGQELFERMGKVRKTLFARPELQALVFAVLAEQGFTAEANAVDPARMRAVTSGGHLNPLAAPAYTAHRDTWYSNPQAQINWWIPMHDVGVGETFSFFPALFDVRVANDSADFDYDRWAAEVGFQNTSGLKAVYPSASGFDEDSALPFACQAGDIMLFAASHLHQTAKNASGATRFSTDFRTVNLDDHNKGLGAPNVDNLCTGSCLADYLGS